MFYALVPGIYLYRYLRHFYIVKQLSGNRDGLVIMTYTLRAKWSSYRASIPALGKLFFFPQMVQTGYVAHLSSYFMRTVARLLGLKWQERDAYPHFHGFHK
jgi:hypothetical protein